MFRDLRPPVLACLLALPILADPAPGEASEIDFGDDASQWSNDGECDDPRFEGPGMNIILVPSDIGHDATDCRTLFEAGQIALIEQSAPVDAVSCASIDYGDDTSQWANDGECDDPRFAGSGMHGILLDSDLGHDATDCRTLCEQGLIAPIGGATAGAPTSDDPSPASGLTCESIDYGDNASQWANDGECDDPRFAGEGMHGILLEVDLGHDANDCRSLCEQGLIAPIDAGAPGTTPTPLDSPDVPPGRSRLGRG